MPTLQQHLTALCESIRICHKNIEACPSEPCDNEPGHLDDAKAAYRLLAGIIEMLDRVMIESQSGCYDDWPDMTSDGDLSNILWNPVPSYGLAVDDLAEALAVAELLCEQDGIDRQSSRVRASSELLDAFAETAVSDEEPMDDLAEALAVAEQLCKRDSMNTADGSAVEALEPLSAFASSTASDEDAIDLAETLAVAEALCELDNADTSGGSTSGPLEPFPELVDDGVDGTASDESDSDDYPQLDTLCAALTYLSSALRDHSVTLEQLECESEGLSEYMPADLYQDPIETLTRMRAELWRFLCEIGKLLHASLHRYDSGGLYKASWSGASDVDLPALP